MTSRTILLVDDDADLLHVLGRRLRSIGLNVQHARNLLTATATIERYVPDVVCVDVEMPTGNGLRFCEMLIADPRTAHVPIIVLTGRNDDETMQACEKLGAHFAFKSADLWPVFEPLVQHLLSELPKRRSTATIGRWQYKPRTQAIPPLPAEADAGNHTSSTSDRQSAVTATVSRVAKRQIVVADDDADLVQMLSERLHNCGCSAIGVHTSLDAINAIHNVQPDMVILDVNMPTGSGLSVCEMMASDDQWRTIPVIILTGCSDEDTIRRCHDMLVFYVQKGADIWRRIEPLVYELLHLDEQPTAHEQSANEPRAKEIAVPKAVGPESGSQDNELIDTVFAMLGADRCITKTTDAVRAVTPPEPIETPWLLCIDDDSDFFDALTIRFDDYGVAVARAADGLAGYRMAFSTPASAILLDYQMPNGQGDYILGRLKDNPVTCDIPVYMITGVRDRMLERRVVAMGAAGFFTKPLDFETLREHLAEHIDALAIRATTTV